jgi:hypothetical protein
MGYPAYCAAQDGTYADTLFQPGNYDASVFGRKGNKTRGYGQGFVPGTVLPDLPASAQTGMTSGPITSLPGVWSESMEVASQLTSQAAASPDGIAPTYSIASLNAMAASAGLAPNAEGGFTLPGPTCIPSSYLLAGLVAALLLL